MIFQAPFEDSVKTRYVPLPCVSTPVSRTVTTTKRRPLCWTPTAASSTCSWPRWRCIRIVWRVKKQWSQRHICRFIDTWDANNFRFWLVEDLRVERLTQPKSADIICEQCELTRTFFLNQESKGLQGDRRCSRVSLNCKLGTLLVLCTERKGGS